MHYLTDGYRDGLIVHIFEYLEPVACPFCSQLFTAHEFYCGHTENLSDIQLMNLADKYVPQVKTTNLIIKPIRIFPTWN